MSDPTTVAVDVVRALTAANMPCAVGGSIALGVWGFPRGTKDADVNVFVPPARFTELLDVLVGIGCAAPGGVSWTPGLRDEFLRRAHGGETAVVWKDEFRVDIFVPPIPFYDEARDTLQIVPLADLGPVPFLSAEALCVFKLLFFRPKDLLDLAALTEARGAALDVAYVRSKIVEMVGEDDDRVRAWDAIVRDHGPPPA